MESSLSDGLNLFGLFGASRTTRARQGSSRAGPAGEEPARARVGQGMQENEPAPGTSRAGPAGEEPALDKDFLLSHIKV